MYEISDLSNLNKSKVQNKYNNLDKFLELENILPHQNTLARGYQKNGNFDYINTSSIKSPDSKLKSNFHTRRLSTQKIANMMEDTYRKVQKDQLIDSGPTKYDHFRSKAKSIAIGALIEPAPSFEFGGRHKSIAADASSSNMQLEDVNQYADSKYLIAYNKINDQSQLAQTLDTIKLSCMTKSNPTYPLNQA